VLNDPYLIFEDVQTIYQKGKDGCNTGIAFVVPV